MLKYAANNVQLPKNIPELTRHMSYKMKKFI